MDFSSAIDNSRRWKESSKLPAQTASNHLEQYHGSESVLLVDDEQIVLSVANSILSRYGYRVHLFADPLTALDSRSKIDFDLVLTDVVMPGMTGPELVKEIHSWRPEIPCIFMSGYDPDQIQARGVDSKCGYLRKPFTPEGLVRHVRTALSKRNGG